MSDNAFFWRRKQRPLTEKRLIPGWTSESEDANENTPFSETGAQYLYSYEKSILAFLDWAKVIDFCKPDYYRAPVNHWLSPSARDSQNDQANQTSPKTEERI